MFKYSNMNKVTKGLFSANKQTENLSHIFVGGLNLNWIIIIIISD